MKDGFEPESEAADLEGVILLDALGEHANALPVVLTKEGVVVRIQRWTLTENSQNLLLNTFVDHIFTSESVGL